MLEKGLQLKTATLLVFLLWLGKFEKSVNNRILDHLDKYALFSNFQYGFRSSDQLQIFWQLYLTELLGLLRDLELL